MATSRTRRRTTTKAIAAPKDQSWTILNQASSRFVRKRLRVIECFYRRLEGQSEGVIGGMGRSWAKEERSLEGWFWWDTGNTSLVGVWWRAITKQMQRRHIIRCTAVGISVHLSFLCT